jgi:flagellar motor switch protein FliN/FliY
LSGEGLTQWISQTTDAPPDESQAEQTLLPLLEKTLQDIAAELHRDLQISGMCPSGTQRSDAPEAEYAVSGTMSSAAGPLSFLFIGPAGDIAEAHWRSIRGKFAPTTAADPGGSGGDSGTMGLLLDVELPLKISFGKSVLQLKDVLRLSAGSVVELNRSPDDPVEIIVNNRVIALGEVVAVDGNYGVRIRKIGGSSRGLDLDELLGSAAANLATSA